jgi:predicted flavoprotein YhiN
VPLVLGGDAHRALQGVAHDVRLTLTEARRRPRRFDGPMLWTHFGASGPAVLDLSRHWLRARLTGHAAEVSASLSPFASFADADGWLQQQASARPRAQVATALGAVLPQSLADFVARSDDTSSPAATPRPPERDGFSGPAGSSAVSPAPALPDASAPMAELTRERRRQLAHKLAAWRMPFLDSRGYTHAEVTAGGVALSEIDPASMRSRICPGLFVVGEVLDVDGRLGGFNFQWAWASARAAADGLASALA